MKKTFLTLSLLLWLVAGKAQNLLDMSNWTIGTGSIGGFATNGQQSENSRVWGIGPDGKRVVLWKAVPEGYADADGGWNHGLVNIDHKSAYRLTVWIKKTGSNGGNTYFGTGYVNGLNDVENSNPYFWYGSLPELDKWYLLVGYIHGSGDNSTVNMGAMYDGLTGKKVADLTDFKFSTNATVSSHRSYLYYDPNTSDEQFFYAPRMERIDGNEPSLNELLGFSPQQKFLPIADTRSEITAPNFYAKSFELNFKEGTTLGLPNNYYTLMGLRGWVNNSGGKAHELAFSNDNKSKILMRSGFEPGWEGWRSLLISAENGNYGIGTDNPRTLFDVAQYISYAQGMVMGRLPEGDGTGNGTFIGIQGFGTDVIDGRSFSIVHNFYGQTNSAINFFRGNSITGGFITFSTNADTERLRITREGNVGIGTTAPQEKLSVNGKIRAHEIKVEAANWPDYVFNDNYKPSSLAELESYIKLNRHLPEMPSAKVVTENGVELGEMNKLLLKKIEELTLHLIEKDKENIQLKKRMDGLEAKLNQLIK